MHQLDPSRGPVGNWQRHKTRSPPHGGIAGDLRGCKPQGCTADARPRQCRDDPGRLRRVVRIRYGRRGRESGQDVGTPGGLARMFAIKNTTTSQLICKELCQGAWGGAVEELPRRRLVAFSRAWVVSVSSATRGQTDIRGLVTAGRCFGWIASACLGSSVEPVGSAHSCVAGRSTRCHHRAREEAVRWRSVVHDRQRPAPAGQFTGDRDVGHGGPLAPRQEIHPPVM